MAEATFKDGLKVNPDGSRHAPVKVKKSESSSRLASHLTVLWADGEYSCSCTGWVIKKKDKPRSCGHIKASKACGAADMTAFADFDPGTTPIKSNQIVIPQGRQLRGIRTVGPDE